MSFPFTASRAALLATAIALPASAEDLPSLTLDPDATTVSGLSSGAFMTVQMHIAFSGKIAGVAVVAGGPYYCAQDQLLSALGSCMKGIGLPKAEDSIKAAEDFAKAGQIDSLDGLKGDRVFLFSGTKDETVVQPVMDVTEEFYLKMGIASDALEYVQNIPAGHAFLAEDGPVPCGVTEEPFISDCDRDHAGNLLKFLYGDLADEVAPLEANLHRFRQDKYISNPNAQSMGDEGFVYIPQSCKDGATCRLHIAFHGCQQGIDSLKDEYVKTTGYNRWAEANDIVVLYPQAIARILQGNPNGCWDWWGYGSPDFATRNGPQMTAVASMATALGAPFIGTGTGDPYCVAYDSFNSVHWQENRATPCGFGELCALGSGDTIGSWAGASTLYETAVGEFQLESCRQ